MAEAPAPPVNSTVREASSQAGRAQGARRQVVSSVSARSLAAEVEVDAAAAPAHAAEVVPADLEKGVVYYMCYMCSNQAS